MRKILSILAIVSWVVFLWIEKLWNEVMEKAVAEKLGTYGELFGPLSFFRPIVLYSAFALTVCLAIMNIKKKLKNK